MHIPPHVCPLQRTGLSLFGGLWTSPNPLDISSVKRWVTEIFCFCLARSLPAIFVCVFHRSKITCTTPEVWNSFRAYIHLNQELLLYYTFCTSNWYRSKPNWCKTSYFGTRLEQFGTILEQFGNFFPERFQSKKAWDILYMSVIIHYIQYHGHGSSITNKYVNTRDINSQRESNKI